MHPWMEPPSEPFTHKPAWQVLLGMQLFEGKVQMVEWKNPCILSCDVISLIKPRAIRLALLFQPTIYTYR